jgi:hypothetical protein
MAKADNERNIPFRRMDMAGDERNTSFRPVFSTCHRAGDAAAVGGEAGVSWMA